MKVVIIGSGYVGLVTGVCFAEMGNKVTCIDIDENKVKKLNAGIPTIYEQGLEKFLKYNLSEKRISFSTSYQDIAESKVVFLAVGTPSGHDGNADLSYLFSALDQMIPYFQDGIVIVLKSTVPIGTNLKVSSYLKERTKKRFVVVNNPEFLKEGNAIEDFMFPERVVIGTDNDEAFELMEELYAPFNRETKNVLRTSNLSAEMIKYASNCFLATKISFMNDLAKLCDYTGADLEEVRTGMSGDSRIGGKFLNPGPGYGGSCFPKDVRALIYKARECGLSLDIVNATEVVNEKQKNYIGEKVIQHFGGNCENKIIALWGVSFKANTDDVRETSALNFVDQMTRAGAQVKFYDPEGSENFSQECLKHGWKAQATQTKEDALMGAHALCVLTEWDEFRSPDFYEIGKLMEQKTLFDGRNLYDTKKVLKKGFQYYAIGKYIPQES